MLDILHGLIAVINVIREDPRIGAALAILLIAGALAALLIRRARRDDPISIRSVRK